MSDRRAAIRVKKNLMRACVEFLVVELGDDGQPVAVATEVIMEDVDPANHTPATFEVSVGAAQGLMDQLWQEGFRPSQAQHHQEEVQAKADHISDLRETIHAQRSTLQIILPHALREPAE